MPKKLDLTGEKYGNLTVIGRCGGKSRYLTWECECACGNRIQADSRYSVTIGFKKKIYYIGCYEDYEDAVQARLIAEKKIHGAFLRANEIWQEKYLQDPEWGEKNPLVFEVSKENGVLIVRNSMESFMKPAQKMMKFADGTFFRKETGTASKDLVVDEEMAMI